MIAYPVTTPVIEEDVKHLLHVESENCTIVHCRYFAPEPTAIRIWQSTFLVENTGKKQKLIQAYNISIMPEWMFCPVVNGYIRFTLVFEGLSKGCSNFYLLEEIPEPGGFISEAVLRNSTDVYNVNVS